MKKQSPYGIQEIDVKMRRKALSEDPDNWCCHCGQHLSVKRHKLNRNMVRFLAKLATADLQYGGGWHRTADLVPRGSDPHHKRSSDGPSLRYWGMLLVADEAAIADGAAPSSYQITQRGLDFLNGFIKVNEYAYVLNGHLWQTGGDNINVHTAFGEYFDMDVEVLLPAEVG